MVSSPPETGTNHTMRRGLCLLRTLGSPEPQQDSKQRTRASTFYSRRRWVQTAQNEKLV